MPDYAILGPLRVTVDGRAVELGGDRQRAVLAILLLHRNRVVPRDALIEAVWGEDPPPTSETALQGHISKLRRILGGAAIETRPPGYVLRTAPADVDVDRFEAHLAGATRVTPMLAGPRLRVALALIRGPAFDDVPIDALSAEVARVDEMALAALERRIDADLETGHETELTAELAGLIERHPYRERFRAQHMLALYRAGRQADALAAYQVARTAFDDELGIDPGPDLQALEGAILRQDSTLAAPANAGGPPWNVPKATSAIIGRESEVARILELLAGGARLVTLTGPGGTGKTRLALEVADRLRGEDPDGAWFVDLTSARSADEGVDAIRSAASLAEGTEGDPFGVIRTHFRDLRTLLVLDNLEQVLDLGRPLAILLSACPGLRVLATSRAPLAIGPETLFAVPPLSVGRSDLQVEFDDVPDAVVLFVDRARHLDPDWAPSAGTMSAVAEICRTLDGLPLAIELAAAKVRLLGPEEMLARIRSGLDVLRSTRRDLSPRQQSLETTVSWSEELLSEAAARVFRRSAVFAGGFTLDTFEVVCGEPGIDALSLLGELIDHSLVQRRQDGSGRFVMLETIRGHAARRLAADAAADDVRLRHLEVHGAIARSACGGLHGPDEEAHLATLRAEQDNLRAALRWADESGHRDALVSLAAAVGPFWVRDHRDREGRDWLARATANPGAGTASERGAALRDLATILEVMGDIREAIQRASASIEAWEASGDQRGLATALRVASMIHNDAGDADQARTYASLALGHAQAAGDERTAVAARHELAFLAAGAGELDDALAYLEDNARVLRAAGDRVWLGGTLSNIGAVHEMRGDLPSAEASTRAAVETFRELGEAASLASSLTTLADILIGADRLAEALQSLTEGIDVARRSEAGREIPAALESLAEIRAKERRPAHAVRVLAAAAAMRDRFGLAASDDAVGQLLVDARDRLGDDEWQTAWEDGAHASLDDLLAADAVGG